MIVPILLLLSLGIAVIYSSSPILAAQQLIFSIIGFVLFFILKALDYHNLKSVIKVTYVVIILLLITTLVIGLESRGAMRWIPLGLFNLQPSEFAKPILILVLAHFWSKNPASWLNILKSFLILLPIAVLVFKQPDLGTTLTISFIWLVMLLGANISLLKIGLLAVLGLISAPIGWLTLQEYQKQRIFTFLSPNIDPQGTGFHVIQSTIAVGSGQIFGRGLGRGTQSRLQFLPEFRTDFIFAFIAEELGFLGSLIVLTLYSILFFMLFKSLYRSLDRFGELILIGVISMLFFQIAVNIGMNTGILPVTGITLPFLSYGGSSIVASLISIGLVFSVTSRLKDKSEVSVFGLS